MRMWIAVLKCLNTDDIKLGADDTRDLDRPAIGYGQPRFLARGSGVTGSRMDIGDFAHAVFGYGRDDMGYCADDIGDLGFARALGMAEELAQKPEENARNAQG